MKRFALPFVFLLLIAFVTSAYAQRGGGGGRADRTPDANATRPTRPTHDPNMTPIFPTRDPNAMPRAIPTDWSSIALPTGLPSREELEAMIELLDLPFDLASLDLPDSSPEAYSALVAFGQTYLGLSIEPLYAGTLDTSTIGSRRGAQTREIPAEISSISTELPAEIQAILANASGVAYYGIFETGVAIVYTASECTQANCSVTMETLQVTLTSGSIGFYSLYSPTVVNDATTAQSLILLYFPALNAYGLSPAEASTGYAFTGTGFAEGQVTAFVAGVLPSENGQSLVYVSYGVGDAYVSLLR
jgi:hypothetical protein